MSSNLSKEQWKSPVASFLEEADHCEPKVHNVLYITGVNYIVCMWIT